MLFKDVVMKAIEERASQLVRKADLTKEQVIAEYLQTPEGAELYGWYASKYADLPVEEAVSELVADMEYAELGMSRQEAVCKAAEYFGGGDLQKGLAIVQEMMPEVYAKAFPR